MLELMIRRLELNNRIWLRKVCRLLGIELVPNFEVEELYVAIRNDEVDMEPTIYVVIGESSNGEYEAYRLSSSSVVYLDKWMVDTDGKVIKVVYKDLKTCMVSCESRSEVINNLTTEYMELTVSGNDDTELALDMFEKEIEEYLDFGNVSIDGTNGVYKVKCKYLVKDRKAFRSIKGRYDARFGN